MKRIYPDYYPDFHCLAGSCPDTCCKDWQIIIDEATLARYLALEGPLGETVRANLIEEDGETRFALTDGHCALLTADGLCSLQLALGEDGLCKTCDAHPRFIEEYGAVSEISLSVSCPAAARLLLLRERPVTFLQESVESPVTDLWDVDADLYLALRDARRAAIGVAQNRRFSIPDRMRLILYLSGRAQGLLNEKRYAALHRLLPRFRDPAWLVEKLAGLRRKGAKRTAFFSCWMVLNNMEHLTKDFPAMLDAVMRSPDAPLFADSLAAQYEYLLVYFLFRYFLKAVNDDQLLPRVQSCVFHMAAIAKLASAQGVNTAESLCPIVSLYSKEVEHSEENLQLLQRVFARGTMKSSYLLSILNQKESHYAV